MFGGLPDMENYIKNVTDIDVAKNPLLNPTMIANAVEIDMRSDELKNYKVRGFADNVIVCEGYCILPHERVKVVQLVPDLIRDEFGNPVLNEKTNEPLGINFRKRTEEEIRESVDEYIASKDYLEYVNAKRLEYGYKDGKNSLENIQNIFKTVKHEGEIEGKSVVINTRANFLKAMKNMFARVSQLKVDENTDVKIDRVLREFTFDKKNPYRDKKFGLAVAKFQTQGLTQLNLKTELENLMQSEEGCFLREKAESIDKKPIRKYGIHGIRT